MIHVDRGGVPKPELRDGPEFRSFLDEWAHFHGAEGGGTRSTQKRAPSAPGEGLEHFRRLALPALLEAFHPKWAYTGDGRRAGSPPTAPPPGVVRSLPL